MLSIAVINQKGGTGKTTTAVQLAAGLALAKRRVLLVDLDPQSHASLHVGVQLSDGEPGIYDVLVQRAALAEVCRRVDERLSLLPAGIDLVAAEIELNDQPRREHRLAAALEMYQGAFDYCLIDCAPSLGLLTINALVAANEVLIPLQPHFLALQGFGRLLETVALVQQELNPTLRVRGVVLCMHETTRLAQEVLQDVTRFLADAPPEAPWHGAFVFDTRIRRNVKLAECPSFGQTIFQYAASSNGSEDYVNLTKELLRALQGRGRAKHPPETTEPMRDEPAAAGQPVPPDQPQPALEAPPRTDQQPHPELGAEPVPLETAAALAEALAQHDAEPLAQDEPLNAQTEQPAPATGAATVPVSRPAADLLPGAGPPGGEPASVAISALGPGSTGA